MRRADKGIELGILDGPLTDEYAFLAEREITRARPIAAHRTAEFLNWRFLANPIWPHRVVFARKAGQLAGFAVFKLLDQRTCVVVEGVASHFSVYRALLLEIARLARQAGLERLDAPVLVGSPLEETLGRAGFIRREVSVGPTLFVPSRKHQDKGLLDRQMWWMVEGDRDA